MKYTDLVFDLYGTLVDIHTEETDLVWEKTAFYFGFHGARYTGAELKAAFKASLRSREAVAGQSYECFPDIPFEQVMAALFRAKGVAEKAEELGFQAAQLFRICSLDYIRLYPGVLDALAKFRRAGYRLWLLSNAQAVFTAYELQLLGLGEQLDGICLSSDYQCRKPDLRFYDALIAGRGLDVSKCLMIGNDRQTDIAGAKAAGMATLYMHTDLTPADQAPADAKKAIGRTDGREYEYEGADWEQLTELILSIG